MSAITISKEAGTESEKLASLLAKELGWEYIGKQLVAQIAGQLRISQSDVEAFRKDSQSRLLRYVDKYTCSIVQKVVDREYGCLDDKNYFETTKKLVEKAHEAGDAIILGWGGQCILHDLPDVLHVRLVKGSEEKIKTIMERHNFNRREAERFIEREENDSKSYIKHYFNEDWNDAHFYDLILDIGKTTLEDAVQTIVENLKRKTGSS